MKIKIRLADESDLLVYTKLLQKTYKNTYVFDAIGLTKECFSKAVFNTNDSQDYLKSNLKINDKQKTWLAFLDKELIGSITIVDKDKECEMRGFYVATDFQGKGIGSKLWKFVLSFAGNREIVLDTYSHNTKTIEIYKNWGFEIDTEKGEFYRHWSEWPEDLKVKCVYMRYGGRQ
jgi:ribosomal protein S18 acetylase RimI-like enzyme